MTRHSQFPVILRLFAAAMLVVLSVAPPAAGQTVPEYENPPFGVGARMAALAESDVSEARDVSGMYWNPASLSLLETHTLFGTHQWTRDLSNDLAALSINIDPENVIALGGLVTQFPALRLSPTSTRNPLQYGIDIGYSHKFTYAFSVGVRMSGRVGQLEGKSDIMAGFGSIGILYAPTPVFSYGVVYNEIGSGIYFLGTGGTAGFGDEHLPGNIEIGVAMRWPSVEKGRALVMSISDQKLLTSHDMRYKIGLEVLPVFFGALRAGYYVEPGSSRPTYGAGLHFGPMSIDYAYVVHKYNFEMHQFSVTAGF